MILKLINKLKYLFKKSSSKNSKIFHLDYISYFIYLINFSNKSDVKLEIYTKMENNKSKNDLFFKYIY